MAIIEGPSELEIKGVPIMVGGGDIPGVYPSGGPGPHMHHIWRYDTLARGFFTLDLYMYDYGTLCSSYAAQANPLLIPEQRRDETGE